MGDLWLWSKTQLQGGLRLASLPEYVQFKYYGFKFYGCIKFEFLVITSSLHQVYIYRLLFLAFLDLAAEAQAHLTHVTLSLRHAFRWCTQKQAPSPDLQANLVGAFGNGVWA